MAKKNKKTPEDIKRLHNIRFLPCCCHEIAGNDCAGRVEAHHKLRDGKRISDQHTMALCSFHHRGTDGVHSGVETFERRFGTQDDMIADTDEKLENFDIDFC